MSSYSVSYKVLHWLMAALIFLMFMAFQGFEPTMLESDRIVMLIGHSSIGTVITVLMVIRFSKRFVLHHKQPIQDLKPNLATVAKVMHLALYGLMILVPLSGYMAANFHQLPVHAFGALSLNGSSDSQAFELVKGIHVFAVQSLLFLVVLHIGAALTHKFVFKDRVMASMRPWRKKQNPAA